MSSLLSDEQRLARPGTAAELAQHCLASHDIPGAFAASIRAGEEAERLGAPAEAHRHYDQALALWDRVTDPADDGRAWPAASSGCSPRPTRPTAATWSGPCTCCVGSGSSSMPAPGRARAGGPAPIAEPGQPDRRAAGLLPDADRRPQGGRRGGGGGPGHGRGHAGRPADLAVRPGPHHLRLRPAGRWATSPWPGTGPSGAIAAARAADAPWVEADALVTLGFMTSREGRNDEAIELLTAAHQAGPRRRGPRRGAARGLPPGPGPPGARRPDHRSRRGARGHRARHRDRPQPGALRDGPAAPALPVPLRGRQVGPRAGDRRRLPDPGHQPARGLLVVDGAVHRRGPGQPGAPRNGGPGSSRSGPPAGSTPSSPAACWPSTPYGRATRSGPWPRRRRRSTTTACRRGATRPRPSGRPRSR